MPNVLTPSTLEVGRSMFDVRNLVQGGSHEHIDGSRRAFHALIMNIAQIEEAVHRELPYMFGVA